MRRRFVSLLLATAWTACGNAEEDASSKPVVPLSTATAIAAPVIDPASALGETAKELLVGRDPEEQVVAKPSVSEREAFDAAYPLHGIAFHFLAQIYSEPSETSRVIGYFRRGTHFRVGRPVEGAGCASGWQPVPGEGFVCRERGVLIGENVQKFEPSPLPPALEEPLPYAYGRVGRDGVPQYWRVPKADEEAHAARAIAAARRPKGFARPAPGQQTGFTSDPSRMEARLSNMLFPTFLRMPMEKGFYVSLDAETASGDPRFARTVRGGFVPREAMTFAEAPPTPGVRLGGFSKLPLGIVYKDGARRYRREPSNGALVDAGAIDRFASFVVADEVTHNGRPYVVDRNGMFVPRAAIRLVRGGTRSRKIPSDGRWVLVDLEEQNLVAYEGDVPVFATLVSTGRPGHDTPTGVYRVEAKHVSTTMQDLNSSDGAYSIEDVPWTMFFWGNYALHGAFWHSRFGRVTSHGCVNLSPADARWLFYWTAPTPPSGWHGVVIPAGRPTSWVSVVASTAPAKP